MKYEFTNDGEGKKLSELISENVSGVSIGAVKHQIKVGEVRVNGVKTRIDCALAIGDIIGVFFPESFVKSPEVKIVYSDDNIAVADKPAGVDTEHNLVSILKNEHSGEFYPVHRLDRNTSGLVILAKTSESEKLLADAIKKRSISKFYRALVYGHFNEKDFTASAYLVKDEKSSLVKIYKNEVHGSLPITTRFKTVEEFDSFSDVEAELITGRTHQIRAHAAFLEHPILGDGKYAPRFVLEKFDYKYQQLRAVKLIFDGLKGKLAYLNGLILQV